MKITKFTSKSKLILISFLLLLVSFLVITQTAQADWLDKQEGLEGIGQKAFGEDGTPDDVRVIAARLISVALGLLGTIFVIIVVIGGFKWMFAGGNKESLEKARKYITNGAIGLLIILAAYAITFFFTRNITGAVSREAKISSAPIEITYNINKI